MKGMGAVGRRWVVEDTARAFIFNGVSRGERVPCFVYQVVREQGWARSEYFLYRGVSRTTLWRALRALDGCVRREGRRIVFQGKCPRLEGCGSPSHVFELERAIQARYLPGLPLHLARKLVAIHQTGGGRSGRELAGRAYLFLGIRIRPQTASAIHRLIRDHYGRALGLASMPIRAKGI